MMSRIRRTQRSKMSCAFPLDVEVKKRVTVLNLFELSDLESSFQQRLHKLTDDNNIDYAAKCLPLQETTESGVSSGSALIERGRN